MLPSDLPPIRALLLDVGGTILLADLDLVARVLAGEQLAVGLDALRTGLVEANREYARVVTGGAPHEDGWDVLVRTWLRSAGLATGEAERGLALLRAAHERHCLWRTPAEGAADGIAAVRAAGIPVGAVSNSEGQLEQILDRAGLGSAFDTVLDSALEAVRKPDPEIFWRACRRLEVAPDDALYAGDIPEVDVRGARAAGLRAALIDPYGVYPDYVEAPRYPSVAALAAAITLA